MQRATAYPVGYRISASIVEVFAGEQPKRPKCVLLRDDARDGYVSLDVEHAITPVKGMRVRLEHTGDNWRITEEVPC